jgi:hypothetical protein
MPWNGAPEKRVISSGMSIRDTSDDPRKKVGIEVTALEKVMAPVFVAVS